MYRTDIENAPEEQKLMTYVEKEDGTIENKQILILSKGLLFLEDKSMYVYYRPTHWRLANEY